MPERQPISVLFVCLGNICRSTMAEGIFQSLANKPPYQGKVKKIDSCGTGAYHVGEGPDDRTMATLEEHGITDYVHRARKFNVKDLDNFDYVFAMDRNNLSDLQRMHKNKPEARAKIMLFGEYSGTGKAEVVQDPWYGPLDGFETTYNQCSRFTKNFLKEVFPEVTPPEE